MKRSGRVYGFLFDVLTPLCFAIVSAVLADLLVNGFGPLNASEVAFLQLQARPKAAPANRDIVVVGITEETPSKLGLPPEIDRVPRKFHARLLQALDAAGAKTALIDLQFDEPRPPDDAILTDALEHLRKLKVTLMTTYKEKSEKSDQDADDSSVEGPEQTSKGLRGNMNPVVVWTRPPNEHVAIGSGWGAQTEASQLYGAVVEQEDLKRQRTVLHMALTAALQFENVPLSSAVHNLEAHTLTAGSIRLSLDENEALPAHWTREASPFRLFEYADALRELKDPATRSNFAGKLVILGDLRRRNDIVDTAPFHFIPGTIFVAQMVNTALLPAEVRIVQAPSWASIGWSALLAMASFWLGSTGRLWHTAAWTIFASIAIFYAPNVFLGGFHWTIPVYGPLIALFLSAALGLVASQTPLQRRDRRIAGAHEDATVLFVDICHSTELIGRIGAERFQALVTEFVSGAQRLLHSHGGEIERTTGDGFLALFRRRRDRHHALRCADAIAGLRRVAATSAERTGIPFEVTMGFETGVVTGGFVREGGRSSWSSAGPAVNLASRLQGACSEFGIDVALGPAAHKVVQEACATRVVGLAHARGFTDPVEVATLSDE